MNVFELSVVWFHDCSNFLSVWFVVKSVFHTQDTFSLPMWPGYESRRDYGYSSLYVSLTLRRFQFLSVLRARWSCEAHVWLVYKVFCLSSWLWLQVPGGRGMDLICLCTHSSSCLALKYCLLKFIKWITRAELVSFPYHIVHTLKTIWHGTGLTTGTCIAVMYTFVLHAEKYQWNFCANGGLTFNIMQGSIIHLCTVVQLQVMY